MWKVRKILIKTRWYFSCNSKKTFEILKNFYKIIQNHSEIMNRNKKVVTPEKVVWCGRKGNTICRNIGHLCRNEWRMSGKHSVTMDTRAFVSETFCKCRSVVQVQHKYRCNFRGESQQILNRNEIYHLIVHLEKTGWYVLRPLKDGLRILITEWSQRREK